MADPIRSFNVGGQLFQARQSTWVKAPYFHALFLGGFAEEREKESLKSLKSLEDEEAKEAKQDEPMFLDFDPELFREILLRLRDPEYCFPVGTKTEPVLWRMVQFFGLDWDIKAIIRTFPWNSDVHGYQAVDSIDKIRQVSGEAHEFFPCYICLNYSKNRYSWYLDREKTGNFAHDFDFLCVIQRKTAHDVLLRIGRYSPFEIIYYREDAIKINTAKDRPPKPAEFTFLSLKNLKEWLVEYTLPAKSKVMAGPLQTPAVAPQSST